MNKVFTFDKETHCPTQCTVNNHAIRLTLIAIEDVDQRCWLAIIGKVRGSRQICAIMWIKAMRVTTALRTSEWATTQIVLGAPRKQRIRQVLVNRVQITWIDTTPAKGKTIPLRLCCRTLGERCNLPDQLFVEQNYAMFYRWKCRFNILHEIVNPQKL